jgi:tRNA (adenine57-N1/adenine58-N1)-methyltransferase
MLFVISSALQVLRHRTQILYVADISLVVANLALTPGKTVLESGTGSGSLTHSLARAVAPHGHVYTFDFHQLRADEARAEFDRHGLTGLVTGGHRNIEEQGFPQVGSGLRVWVCACAGFKKR